MTATPLRSIRVNTETWEAAKASAAREETALSAVMTEFLELYGEDPELWRVMRNCVRLMRDEGYTLAPPAPPDSKAGLLWESLFPGQRTGLQLYEMTHPEPEHPHGYHEAVDYP